MQVVCIDFYGKTHTVDASELIDRSSVYGLYATNDTVLLVQDPRSLRWELPGGGIEMGETDDQCLIREFVEETGARPTGKLTLLNEWTEYYYAADSQEAWRSQRKFYLVEGISSLDDLMGNGNGDDTARAQLVPITALDVLVMAPRIKQLVQQTLSQYRR